MLYTDCQVVLYKPTGTGFSGFIRSPGVTSVTTECRYAATVLNKLHRPDSNTFVLPSDK